VHSFHFGADAPEGEIIWEDWYIMIIRGLAAWLLAAVLFTSAAYAHGGVGMVDNRCVLRIGPDIMFFTGYQPQSSRDEFCDDIPSIGQTVVALDMQDTELRNMLTEIRLIKDDGTHTRMNGLPFLTDAELANKSALDSVSINYVPPKKYPTGTLTFEHTFPETGKFIGIRWKTTTARNMSPSFHSRWVNPLVKASGSIS
jgi:hypothetical protein